MPRTPNNVPTRVTSDLQEAEAALNEALHKQSQLLSSMLAARQHYGEPFLGQEAFMRLLKSQESLLTAGGDLARVHHGLLKIGEEKGAVIHDCPENEPMRRAAQELRSHVGADAGNDLALLKKVTAFG